MSSAATRAVESAVSAQWSPTSSASLPSSFPSVDSDGFALVQLRDDSGAAEAFSEAGPLDSADDDDDEGEDDEENEERQEDDDAEFPDIESLLRGASVTPLRPLEQWQPSSQPQQSQHRSQIGGSDDGSSSEDDGDDSDDDAAPVVRQTADRSTALPADASAILDRIMRHHATATVPALSASFSRHTAASNVTPAASDDLAALRKLLELDSAGSLERLKARAAQRVQEIALEHAAVEPVELSDLLALVPSTREEEEKQPQRSRPAVIMPAASLPAEDDPFFEEAAMIAAEMTDSEEEAEDSGSDYSSLQPSNLSTHEFAFSDLSSLQANPVAPSSSAAPSDRLSRYAASSTAASAAVPSTSALLARAAAHLAGVAPAPSAATPSSLASRLPSAAAARQGIVMEEESKEASPSAVRAAPITRVSATPSDGTGSLFTSEALSFLRFTPDQARKLHSQFTREQAVFAQQHELTQAPDAALELIAPAGRDDLDPAQFRS